MNRPLVSVMIPCHNAAKTLPRALASLLAQTWPAWECVMIDDGSTDESADVLAAFADERMRLEVFPAARGRGAARQQALERCRGELLCMLDADDWMYPDRIERQVHLLERHPGAVLVTSALAVVDGRDHFLGVREPRGRGMPPGPFASSMIRADAARTTGFDRTLILAEDADFMSRLLQARHYIVDSVPVYTYAEYCSFDPAKTLASLAVVRRVFARQLAQRPLHAATGAAITSAKIAWYRGAFALGMGDRVLHRRWRPPTAAEIARHAEAATAVAACVRPARDLVP